MSGNWYLRVAMDTLFQPRDLHLYPILRQLKRKIRLCGKTLFFAIQQLFLAVVSFIPVKGSEIY